MGIREEWADEAAFGEEHPGQAVEEAQEAVSAQSAKDIGAAAWVEVACGSVLHSA